MSNLLEGLACVQAAEAATALLEMLMELRRRKRCFVESVSQLTVLALPEWLTDLRDFARSCSAITPLAGCGAAHMNRIAVRVASTRAPWLVCTLEANTLSHIWQCMTARRCANVLAGGVQFSPGIGMCAGREGLSSMKC